ncbi:hypothetical protein BGW36DRAFT_370310 [Talaromyces proteolyticus]|uniref:Uncharacterized protein n=1 Tax=Talaromyces proteolyticus TaxID=1131652 RepID=A0AAD4L4B1_9EURO|nr:uncharacterized protein BGW36DRAFT_370310 [Talaromyces proteolyticus]KAH8703963.1 hypothetical protein BGW36DRAFT_370310 [Talaromyces proteolyticus]
MLFLRLLSGHTTRWWWWRLERSVRTRHYTTRHQQRSIPSLHAMAIQRPPKARVSIKTSHKTRPCRASAVLDYGRQTAG